MAKPIMYFKGVKFKAGQTIGYRPQLETTQKVTDATLAEEICINAGLSMSPTELLHAVQMTLETAPRLVASDGRIREFTNLMAWNRTASGRLAGQTSPWNDTCSAKVSVQLKKNSKQLIDGIFRNSLEVPTPRVDNVTWIGAQGVTNVIKVGEYFAAYGRNLQFDTSLGDFARINDGLNSYTLTCTESDVSHAKFSWPVGYNPEEGRRVTVEIASRGGIEGGALTVNEKKVVVIAGEEPKLQIKINTCSFTASDEGLQMTGENVAGALGYVDAGEGELKHVTAYISVNGGTPVTATLNSVDGDNWGAMYSGVQAQRGDTITYTLRPDPAKSSVYEQIEATKSCTAT